jgi:hypothetical protein
MRCSEKRKRRLQAEALVGCYVRFAHLPSKCYPTPILVTEAEHGMIRLEGWAGYFAPHLFVVVVPSKEAA